MKMDLKWSSHVKKLRWESIKPQPKQSEKSLQTMKEISQETFAGDPEEP